MGVPLQTREQMGTLEKRFGRRLRLVRHERRGETRKELGNLLGVDSSAVYRWENGEGAPRGAVFLRLLVHYREDARFLLFGDASDPESQEPEDVPPALKQFLKTPLGRAAEEHGLREWLIKLPLAEPPTVELYMRITLAVAPQLIVSR